MSQISRYWFQPGEGIAREVITADIQRYLGRDATVRPGMGTGEYQEMVADLQLDSRRWLQEGRVSYPESRTHQSRQHYGPTTPAGPSPEVSTGYSPSVPNYSREGQQTVYTSGRQPAPATTYSEPNYTYAVPGPGYAPPGAYYDQGSSPQYEPRTASATPYQYAQPAGGRDRGQYVEAMDPRGAYPGYGGQQPGSSSTRIEQPYSPSTSTQYQDPYARSTYGMPPPRARDPYNPPQPPSANDSRPRRRP
ncbi:MAG: hypothetical protein M1822_001712 [Bathelium mastoideum]|nr:MAG: hypothetical protein M1822_001712 [Bathelium mastoideum]